MDALVLVTPTSLLLPFGAVDYGRDEPTLLYEALRSVEITIHGDLCSWQIMLHKQRQSGRAR